MHPISESLKRYYMARFASHGPTPEGVDWGPDKCKMLLRYEKMLAVMHPMGKKPSVLDVGCGYGGLFSYLAERGLDVEYTGIDVAENMIEWACNRYAQDGNFLCGDVLTYTFNRQFDYVVCNGILTQKLDAQSIDMDRFSALLIRRLFDLSKHGLAFNVMTTKVNFFSNNLYYRNPSEMLSWCICEITPHIKLDHAYPLYEYTVYLYREPLESGFSAT